MKIKNYVVFIVLSVGLLFDVCNKIEGTLEKLNCYETNQEASSVYGGISPEGMKIIPVSKSLNGKDLLLFAFEVSESTVVYEVK